MGDALMQGMNAAQAVGALSFLVACYLLKSLHNDFRKFVDSVTEKLQDLNTRTVRLEVANAITPDTRKTDQYFPHPDRRQKGPRGMFPIKRK